MSTVRTTPRLENCKNSVLNFVELKEFIVRIIVLKCSL
jgi:hypothetical protein